MQSTSFSISLHTLSLLLAIPLIYCVHRYLRFRNITVDLQIGEEFYIIPFLLFTGIFLFILALQASWYQFNRYKKLPKLASNFHVFTTLLYGPLVGCFYFPLILGVPRRFNSGLPTGVEYPVFQFAAIGELVLLIMLLLAQLAFLYTIYQSRTQDTIPPV